MPKKSENYVRDPAGQLIEILRACEWEPIRRGLWAKGQYRLLVDDAGIFFFQFYQGQWARTQGLSFADFNPQFLADQIILFIDKSKLNLAGGR